jgi:hypothetical protein
MIKEVIGNIITGIVILIIVYFGGVFVYNKYIKNIDNTEQFDDLKTRFDSLSIITSEMNLKIDTINSNTKDLQFDMDTVKTGLFILYNEINKDELKETSFWDYFKL